MSMAATSYKTRSYTDRDVAIAIIQGFTGQLKGWWDNLYLVNEKEFVLDSKYVTRSFYN